MAVATIPEALEALEALAVPPPRLPADVVAAHLQREYGLAGTLEPLVSERDQNFRLRRSAGRDLVVKIAGTAEERLVTEFQVAALTHLEACHCIVSVPRVIAALDGSGLTTIEDDGRGYSLRVVSWIGGQSLDGATPEPALARELGRALAHIDCSLAEFEHPGDQPQLLWDMQRAKELLPLTRHIHDPRLRGEVENCLVDFATRVLPTFAALRRQVIHNDLNPGNVLVGGTHPQRVVGVIDFGDMLRAPLVADVAIAIAYLRCFDEDPLAPLASFVGGFHEVMPLEAEEVELLYDLLRTRLATTITILHWRSSARGAADAYLQKSLAESSAQEFLRRISALSRSAFGARMREALGSRQAI